MNKTLFISILLFALGGCATPTPQVTKAGSLLNFADLADEITVYHEVTESTAAVQQENDKTSTD